MSKYMALRFLYSFCFMCVCTIISILFSWDMRITFIAGGLIILAIGLQPYVATASDSNYRFFISSVIVGLPTFIMGLFL